MRPGAVAHATFPCSLCQGTAASVWLAPRGTPEPDRGSGTPPEANPAYARIGVEAGPLSVTIGGQVVDHALPAILAALETRDPAALYAADLEFAPFWCPDCAASYCGRHWQVWPEFDPEDPGWFEEQRGICPRGHERMLLD